MSCCGRPFESGSPASTSARSTRSHSDGWCRGSSDRRSRDRCSRKSTKRPAGIRSTRSRSCACCSAPTSPSRPGQPLPVPESLHELVHARLLALPPESRDYLLAAAAHAHPTVALTEEASGVERAIGLAPAVAAGVVELAGDRIRLHAPSVGSGCVRGGRSSPATGSPCPSGRAARRPRSSSVAARGVGRRSPTRASRGSWSRPRRTPATVVPRGPPRCFSTARASSPPATPTTPSDGLSTPRTSLRVRRLAASGGAAPKPSCHAFHRGRSRARAVVRLARVRSYEAQSETPRTSSSRPWRRRRAIPRFSRVAHEGVATCLYRTCERLVEAVDHATVAAELALGLGDEPLGGGSARHALGTRASAGAPGGGRHGARRRERSSLPARVGACSPSPASPRPRVISSGWAGSTKLDTSSKRCCDGPPSSGTRAPLRRSSRRSAKSSASSDSSRALAPLRQKARKRRHSAGSARSSSTASPSRASWRRNAVVVDLARAAARRALELVPQTGGRHAELIATRALGIAGLSSGALAETVGELSGVVAFARREAIAEPGAIPFVVDYIEALIELGRRDEAGELLDWYEGNARRLERIPALADCARCRGLLAAQEGELDGAFAAFGEALELHDAVELPLRKARRSRARSAAAPREAAARGSGDARAGSRAFRGRRRCALGRARAHRARPHQRPGGDARRAHAGRGARRDARRRGEDEP